MNVYLTAGAVHNVITGFPIRDLDFTVQGNALKLQKELEKAGAVIGDADQETRSLLLTFPGGVRAEIAMARSERYEKTGKPPLLRLRPSLKICGGAILPSTRWHSH